MRTETRPRLLPTDRQTDRTRDRACIDFSSVWNTGLFQPKHTGAPLWHLVWQRSLTRSSFTAFLRELRHWPAEVQRSRYISTFGKRSWFRCKLLGKYIGRQIRIAADDTTMTKDAWRMLFISLFTLTRSPRQDLSHSKSTDTESLPSVPVLTKNRWCEKLTHHNSTPLTKYRDSSSSHL